MVKTRQIQVRQPDGTIRIIQQQIVTAPAPVKPQDQKVQIIRGADGKLSVKGLVAGQQLIQMPDGKIHIVNTTQQGSAGVKTVVAGRTLGTTPTGQQIILRPSPGPAGATATGAAATTKTVIQKIVTPGQPNILQKAPHTKLIASKVMPTSTTADGGGTPTSTTTTPGQSRVVTTSLQQLLAQNPGQKIVVNSGTPNQRILVAGQVQQQQQQGQQQILVQQQPGGQVVQQIVLNSGQRIVAGSNTGTPIKTIVQQQQQQQQSPVTPQQTQPQQVQYQIQQSPATPVQQQQPPQSNGSIAQQLASGKLRMINYNGQQVIIKPLSNNSAMLIAHVKQQENGPAQIIVTPQGAAAAAANDSDGGNMEQQQTATEAMPEAGTSSSVAVATGTPIVKSITAQILQTPNGPRIVLQGLGQDELSQQQLAEVQQQVKQQLMKGEFHCLTKYKLALELA